MLKTSRWTYKNKDLNEENIIGSFFGKELLLSYYSEADSHIRGKIKIVLDLSNYATKKELNDLTGVDIYNIVAKIDFVALKPEADKLDINKLINVPSGLKNLKIKVDKLGNKLFLWNLKN